MKRQIGFYRRNKCLTSVALFCMIGSVPFPASATSSFAVKVESDSASAKLELKFPEGIACEGSTPDPRELLLQCDREIDPPSMDDVLAQTHAWIAWISNGYDTLLIHAARDLSFGVSSPSPDRIVLKLTPVESKPKDDSNPVVPLLLRSQLLAATGKPGAAAALLHRVLESYPADGQALADLAELELRANRWRRALDLYSKAIVEEPRNEDLISIRRKVLNEHAPVISYETNLKDVAGQWTEFVSSTSGDWPLSAGTKARFHIEENRFHSFGRDARVQFRSRMEASVQHDFLNGSNLDTAILKGGPELGGRIVYNRTDMSGKTYLEATYGISFWDLLPSLEGYGLRDRISAGRGQQFGTKTTVQMSIALNRYRLQDAVVRRTYGITGGVNYTLRKQYPAVELNYVVDLEKRTDRLQSSGFSLSNRDVHAIGSAVGMPVGPKAEILVSGGMSLDIDGGRGPFISARFKRHLTERLSAEFWVERRQNSVLTGNVVRNLGATLKFSFPRKESP